MRTRSSRQPPDKGLGTSLLSLSDCVLVRHILYSVPLHQLPCFAASKQLLNLTTLTAAYAAAALQKPAAQNERVGSIVLRLVTQKLEPEDLMKIVDQPSMVRAPAWYDEASQIHRSAGRADEVKTQWLELRLQKPTDQFGQLKSILDYFRIERRTYHQTRVPL